MSENAKKVLILLLPVVILVGIVFTYKGLTRKPHSESGYAYTAYGIADDGTVYVFKVRGAGLKWPVTYEDKKLKPLYGCADCGHLFPGNIGAMTTRCPNCEGGRVGAYDKDLHGPLETDPIEIEVKTPK